MVEFKNKARVSFNRSCSNTWYSTGILEAALSTQSIARENTTIMLSTTWPPGGVISQCATGAYMSRYRCNLHITCGYCLLIESPACYQHKQRVGAVIGNPGISTPGPPVTSPLTSTAYLKIGIDVNLFRFRIRVCNRAGNYV